MQLPQESVEEFRKIYKKEFGKVLSYEKAEEASSNLLEFFKLLIKIDLERKN